MALHQALDETLLRVASLRGLAVSDNEGLPIVNRFRHRFDTTTVSAMAALIQRSSLTVFNTLNYPSPDYVVLHSPDADIYVQSVGRDAFIFAVADPGSNVGYLHIVLRELANRLQRLLVG